MSQAPFLGPATLVEEDFTASEAAHRLLEICDLLDEVYQVPAEQLDELRAIGQRFTHQLQNMPVFQDKLIEFARKWCRA